MSSWISQITRYGPTRMRHAGRPASFLHPAGPSPSRLRTTSTAAWKHLGEAQGFHSGGATAPGLVGQCPDLLYQAGPVGMGHGGELSLRGTEDRDGVRHAP
jgi:hypothetical protein